jgi:hypothetical protein
MAYKMPPVVVGDVVLYHADHGNTKPVPALVVDKGDDSVVLHAFVPGSLTPQIEDGVRHASDPINKKYGHRRCWTPQEVAKEVAATETK